LEEAVAVSPVHSSVDVKLDPLYPPIAKDKEGEPSVAEARATLAVDIFGKFDQLVPFQVSVAAE
jgi:hypothetical protein